MRDEGLYRRSLRQARQYMVQYALDRDYEVVGVCREQSVAKLDAFKGRMTVIPGPTDDREVIKKAVGGAMGFSPCWSPGGCTGTREGRLRRCSISRHQPRAWCSPAGGTSPGTVKTSTRVGSSGRCACSEGSELVRAVDLDDQVEACRRVLASDTRWTVVRGSELEAGESQGLPVWSRHVGDPILASNLTRRVDFALFMVAALENDELIHEAPAIVGCQTPSALAHAADVRTSASH